MKHYTHTLAVGAHIIREKKIVLLQRNKNPKIWAPPGGHLLKNENPYEGLKREILEECNINIDIIAPTLVHSGIHNGIDLIAIYFYCRIKNGELILSSENKLARWFSLSELKNGVYNGVKILGKFTDYSNSFKISELFTEKNNYE